MYNFIYSNSINYNVNTIFKFQYIRGLKNFGTEQPYQHAVYYLAVLLADQVWVKDELLEASTRKCIFSNYFVINLSKLILNFYVS